MNQKKGGRGQQRASVPEVYRTEMGKRLKQMAMDETARRSQEARRAKRYRPATLTALHAELYHTSGIPPRIMEQYESGIRVPSIMDLRAIAFFFNVSMEHLMQDVPPSQPPHTKPMQAQR